MGTIFKMRHYTRTLILILFCLLTQTIQSQNEIPKYFPESSFDCDSVLDHSSNQYWSSWLYNLKKPILYNTKDYTDYYYTEYYRLLYWGSYLAVVNLIINRDSYIVITDSLGNNFQATENKDLILAPPGLYIIDSIKGLVPELIRFRSYENCTKKDDLIFIDDRDSWVIEFKIGDKYKIIERKEPEDAVEKYILLMMKLAKLNGFMIYESLNNYKSY